MQKYYPNLAIKATQYGHLRPFFTNTHIQPLYRICLTGGPCAGKTTALTHLTNVLSQLGYRVFCVPEAATILMKGGAMINSYRFSFNQGVKFQAALMRTQMALEDNFVDLALNEMLPTVVLCDRGLMDGQAYVSEEMWQSVLEEMDITHMQLRDRRYEAVIHMVTAAEGAEDFYNKGNEARYENIQQAIDVDRRLRNAYLGHHKFFIVDNQDTSFAKKIDKVVDIVSKIVEKPSPNSAFKKFILYIPNPDDHSSLGIPPDVKIATFEVVETLIKPKTDDDGQNIEIYIRKRGKNNSFVYNQEIRFTKNNERIQKQRMITGKEYLELLSQKVPQIKTLHKARSCFVFENQAYTIDTIENVQGKPTFLRAETHHQTQFKIPPFLKVLKDVTADNEFSSYSLARPEFKLNI